MKSQMPSTNSTGTKQATQKRKTKRKPAHIPLADSLDYIQTIFEKSPVGMLTCKATGEIISANQELAQLSGGTIEQIEQQNFRNLKLWQKSGILSAAEDALASGVERTFEGHTVTDFGKEIQVSCLFTPFSYKGEQYLLVMLTDITKSKQAEEEILHSMEELATLNTIGLQANSSLSTDEIIAKIVGEIVITLRTAHTFIFLREGEKLLLKASRAAEGMNTLKNIPEHRVGECICGLAVTEGRSLYSRDIFTDARCTWEECKQAGLRSFAALPLRDGDEIIGVLGLASLEERDFEKQSAFLETLASQISLGLKNARLYERLRGELTERNHAEKELHESEQKFRNLIEQSTDGVVIVDEKGIIINWNKRQEQITGITQAEAIGHTMWDMQYQMMPEEMKTPPTLERLRNNIIDLLKTGQSSRLEKPIEATIQLPDGTHREVEIVIYQFKTDRGFMAGGITRDITARKQAEQALRESEERFRRFTQVTFEGIVIHDGKKVLDVNPAVHAMFGYEPSEVIGQEILKFVAPESRELIVKSIQAQGEKPIEVVGLRKDGSAFPLEVMGKELFHTSSTLRVTALHDITERKRAEETLAESNAKFHALFESSPDAIMLIDPQGNWPILDCNAAACRMNGYTREELVGQSIDILNGTPDGSSERAEYMEHIQHGDVWHVEAIHRRKDGSLFPIEISTSLITVGGRKIVLGIDRDITERRQADEALRESEEKYRMVVESANDGITIIQNGIVKFVNQLLAEMWGGKVEDVLETPFINYIHPDEEPAIRERYQRRLAGEDVPSIYQTVLMRRDGSIVWGEIKASVITYQGSPADLIMVRDITERKQAEVLLQRRLKELTVLHEVANAAAQSASVDELLEGVTQVVNDSLFPDNCGVLLYEETGNVLHHHPSYRGGNEKKSPDMRIPLGMGVTGSVAASRKPARIPDVKGVTYYINVDVSSRSELCVPVMIGERLLGVINAESAKLDAFTESDENLMITIASTLATAIEKIRLFEETSRRLEHVQALHRIDTAINSSLDLDLTFNIFLEQIMHQLGVDAADILVLQPSTQTLQYHSGLGFRTTALQHTQLRLGQGYAGLAGQERRTIHISDLRTDKTDFIRSPDFKSEEFDTYLGVPLIAKGQLKGVLEVFQRGPLESDLEWLDLLEILAGQAAIAIDNVTLFNDLQRANFDLKIAYDATIEGWSRALDLRDEETEGHTRRVADLTVKLAQDMGMNEADQVNVRRGTLLHDIGKMAVPDNILRKPSSLTDEEWVIMRKHPQFAYEMLSPITYLHAALDIPYCHHEKWDGSGYPRGLKREQIPLAARIFTVVDVYDALTSKRPYRNAWSKKKTLAYIREKADQFFDPNVVAVFLREIETIK